MNLSSEPLAAPPGAAGKPPLAATLPHGALRLLPGREDFILLATIAAIVAATRVLLATYGISQMDAWVYAANTELYGNAIILTVLVGMLLGPLRISGRAVSFDISGFSAREEALRVVRALLVLFAISSFMVNFSALKSSIEVLNPFSWDRTFILFDRSLHGDDPWRILQPFIGHPAITRALSAAYHLWFLLIYLGPVWFAIYQKDRVLRLRFFLGYILTWTICGMVLAVMLSSVGPCFVGPLLGDPHYAEQMAYLHNVDRAAPLFVIDIQEQLLTWYRSGSNGLGHGITAMPSMHVALATMYAFAMRKVDRRLGWLFAGFAIVIEIASVHLGYHYAVDGYVAAAVTAAIWLATKPLAGLILGRREQPRGRVLP